MVAATGTTHARLPTVPASAPDHTLRPAAPIDGIVPLMMTIGILTVYILRPFKYITEHVIKSKGIRLETPHGGGHFVSVITFIGLLI